MSNDTDNVKFRKIMNALADSVEGIRGDELLKKMRELDIEDADVTRVYLFEALERAKAETSKDNDDDKKVRGWR